MGCIDVRLGGRLLESESLGHAVKPHDPLLADHLDACASCRELVGRMRRAREAWSEGAPSEDEVRRAFERLRARREKAEPGGIERVSKSAALLVPKSVWAFAGAGALLATGLLWIAAPRSAGPRANGQSGDEAASLSDSIAGGGENAAGPYVESAAGRTALADGLRVRLVPGERALIVLGGKWRPIQVNGPGLLEARSAPAEVSGWRLEFAAVASQVGDEERGVPQRLVPLPASDEPPGPDSPSESIERLPQPPEATAANGPEPPVNTAANGPEPPGGGAATDPTAAGAEHGPGHAGTLGRGLRITLPVGNEFPSPAVQSAWSRAAQALDRNDFDAADAALAELCADPDRKTKDAARLTRAKLWIARGRGNSVRPVLEDLANTGATALVRRDARELLDKGLR